MPYYKKYSLHLLLQAIIVLGISNAFAGNLANAPIAKQVKNIILIAGEKSHDPGEHEYVKTVRLIKVMLDHANLKNVNTWVYLHGWPPADSLLNHANLILFVTDGADGLNFKEAPFMTPHRMAVLQRQINRGCGLALLHFSTFAAYDWGQKLLQWTGGYYDWQDATGKRRHYSDLRIADVQVLLASPQHPISNGVKPFKLREEFYYNMRFVKLRKGLAPVLKAPALGAAEPWGNVVAWALQRDDGSRAFSATVGHFYANWQNDNFRKVLLNGLIWAARSNVPANGANGRFYTDEEVDQLIGLDH